MAANLAQVGFVFSLSRWRRLDRLILSVFAADVFPALGRRPIMSLINCAWGVVAYLNPDEFYLIPRLPLVGLLAM